MVSCVGCSAKDSEVWVQGEGEELRCWDCAVKLVPRGGAYAVSPRARAGRPLLIPQPEPAELIAKYAGGEGDGPKPMIRPRRGKMQ